MYIGTVVIDATKTRGDGPRRLPAQSALDNDEAGPDKSGPASRWLLYRSRSLDG
jgi:hypothetical protein